jgi:hypothetical protein
MGEPTISKGNDNRVAEHLLDIKQLERDFQELRSRDITAQGEQPGDRRPNRLPQHNPVFLIALFVNFIFILEDINFFFNEDPK